METNEKSAAVKGLVLRNIKSWFQKEYGNQGVKDFLETLSPDEQELWIVNNFLPFQWYPAKLYQHMYESVNMLYGDKDPDAFKRGAANVAFQDLSTIMKVFMKLGAPSFVATRFPIAYRHYFNTGLMVIRNRKNNYLSLELIGAQVYGLASCNGVIGWTSMALDYAGAKNLVTEHPHCYFKGHSSCIINYTWDI